jgi:hypothetical protein
MCVILIIPKIQQHIFALFVYYGLLLIFYFFFNLFFVSLTFSHLQAVTKAKLGYNPLEVNPEDMVRFAMEQPQVRLPVSNLK